MIEVDKLKMLLLTPEQLKLFDYLPRPKLELKKQNKKVELFD